MDFFHRRRKNADDPGSDLDPDYKPGLVLRMDARSKTYVCIEGL